MNVVMLLKNGVSAWGVLGGCSDKLERAIGTLGSSKLAVPVTVSNDEMPNSNCEELHQTCSRSCHSSEKGLGGFSAPCWAREMQGGFLRQMLKTPTF